MDQETKALNILTDSLPYIRSLVLFFNKDEDQREFDYVHHLTENQLQTPEAVYARCMIDLKVVNNLLVIATRTEQYELCSLILLAHNSLLEQAAEMLQWFFDDHREISMKLISLKKNT